MKGKLHKMESGYILSLNGDIDDPYAIVNEELAKDYEWYKLSIKNCQAIELGYDLDEVVEDIVKTIVPNDRGEDIWYGTSMAVGKLCFQKALELMGDKKFSDEDVILIAEYIRVASQSTPNVRTKDLFDEYQSLQQKEWDVEIVEECLDKNCDGINKKGGCITTGKPKLDKEGCLILKKL